MKEVLLQHMTTRGIPLTRLTAAATISRDITLKETGMLTMSLLYKIQEKQ